MTGSNILVKQAVRRQQCGIRGSGSVCDPLWPGQRDPSQGGLGFDYALVGEPRTFGLDLTYRF